MPFARMTQPSPAEIGPMAHLLVGAASGILALVGLQYLMVRWTEYGVERACRTLSE